MFHYVKIANVIDTVGAGDTFNGNLAAALTHGYNLKEAIYRAQFASAMKLGRKTAQKGMPYKNQLDTYIDAYEHGKKVVWKSLEDEEEYTFDKNAIS